MRKRYFIPLERQPLVEEKKAKLKSEPIQGTKSEQLMVRIMGDTSKRLGGLDNGRISMQKKVSANNSVFWLWNEAIV